MKELNTVSYYVDSGFRAGEGDNAIQKFHHDEWMPTVFADFVNRADVRMIQRRGCLGFALKAAQSLRVLRYIVG